MKKYFFSVCAAIVLLFAVTVHAQESIRTFDTRLQVNADGTMNVSEAISYDFGNAQRHGIFRDIPVKYRSALGRYSMSLSAVSVIDGEGSAYPFTVSRQGSQQRIKIGDPDRLISGAHTYIISYVVHDAVGFFKDHDEIYWNAVGTDWEIPIQTASAVVSLPGGIPVSQVSAECYVGSRGSKSSCEVKKVDAASSIFDHATFGQTRLDPQQGLTIVVSFPKGIVTEPSPDQKVWSVIQNNWVVAVPFIVFIFMFWLWRSKGRDPSGRGTIIAEYEPPDGLTPGQVGTLLDQGADNKDVSAEIINLAVKGYLTIERVVTDKIMKDSVDYIFTQIKESDGSLAQHEDTLLTGLFSTADATEAGVKNISLSDLKQKFYTTQAAIKADLYASLVGKKFFVGYPNRIRAAYIGAGFVIGGFGAGVLGNYYGTLGVISLLLSGATIVLFGWAMPRRSQEGVLEREKILGFKEFLSVTETDRLKFHNAPEKNPKQFEQFLPYAMVLGVEKQWADQFKDIYTAPPSWYRDASGGAFVASAFASDIRSFSTQAASTLAANPASGGSGGSGFSGGGGGGGGGGSW